MLDYQTAFTSEKLQRRFEVNVKVATAFGCHLISGTGNTVIEAVKVLIEHGVQPSVIILLSLFSTPHGECSMTGHGLGKCISVQTLIVKKSSFASSH